jgi:hypothetical protein
MGKPVGITCKDEMAAEMDMGGSDNRCGASKDDLIFSLSDGYVWVSWPGTVASVKLGAQDPVRAMMKDFLAQCEVGDRLTNARRLDA